MSKNMNTLLTFSEVIIDYLYKKKTRGYVNRVFGNCIKLELLHERKRTQKRSGKSVIEIGF